MEPQSPPGLLFSVPLTRRVRIGRFKDVRDFTVSFAVSLLIAGFFLLPAMILAGPVGFISSSAPAFIVLTAFLVSLAVIASIKHKKNTLQALKDIAGVNHPSIPEKSNTFKASLCLPFRPQKFLVSKYELDAVPSTPKNAQGFYKPPLQGSDLLGMHLVQNFLLLKPGSIHIVQSFSLTSLGIWDNELLYQTHCRNSDRNST